MKKTIAMALVFLAVVSLTTTAHAQDATNARIDLRAQQGTNLEMREQFKVKADTLRNQRLELNNTIKVERDSIRVNMQADKAEMRERMQNAETPEEREAIKQEAQVQREEYKQENAELRDQRKVESQVIVSQRADLIVMRYDAVIQRVEDILARLESRIDELQVQGVDVAAAEQFTADAHVSLENASLNFNQALDLYTSIDTTTMAQEEVKAALDQSRVLLQSAKADIKAAWDSAREALTNLKASVRVETSAEVTS